MIRIALFVVALALTTAQPAVAEEQASKSTTHVLKAQIRKAKSTINWWNHRGRWALAPQRKWCWSFIGVRRERVCKMARADLRRHLAMHHRAKTKLERLTAPRYPVALRSAWECIHSHEGSWTANTGNGYYGGLQMDLDFQRAYGAEFLARWGTANNWPPLVQMYVAERAYNSGRGFGPWPTTARMCGL